MHIELLQSCPSFTSKQMEIRWQTGKVAMVYWLQGFSSNQKKAPESLPPTIQMCVSLFFSQALVLINSML